MNCVLLARRNQCRPDAGRRDVLVVAPQTSLGRSGTRRLRLELHRLDLLTICRGLVVRGRQSKYRKTTLRPTACLECRTRTLQNSNVIVHSCISLDFWVCLRPFLSYYWSKKRRDPCRLNTPVCAPYVLDPVLISALCPCVRPSVSPKLIAGKQTENVAKFMHRREINSVTTFFTSQSLG